MLIHPDAFPGDPYGYAANQCGHAVIGMALAVVWACLSALWPVPVIAAVCYYLAVEVAQGWSWDGVEDAVFTGFGAALPAAIIMGPIAALGVIVTAGALMAYGVWRRW